MRFGFWEIIIIACLVFILFGSQKFPGMMKNLAEGIKVFKKEISGDKKEKPPFAKASGGKPETKPAPKKKPVKKK